MLLKSTFFFKYRKQQSIIIIVSKYNTIGPLCHLQMTRSELGSASFNYCNRQLRIKCNVVVHRERERQRVDVLLSKWKCSQVLETMCHFGFDRRHFATGLFLQLTTRPPDTSFHRRLISSGLHRNNQVKTLTTGGWVDEQSSCLCSYTWLHITEGHMQLSGLWLHTVKLPLTVRRASLALRVVNTLIVSGQCLRRVRLTAVWYSNHCIDILAFTPWIWLIWKLLII